ncbi:MAG TPA: hypothetical protein VNN12_02480 [Dehalococcoidia bacterium]|jgi:uncharacterized protein with von Willebrand factor type A (vWA) domain|nr:hypothetical protein [Dehalococcoidia bacterium]
MMDPAFREHSEPCPLDQARLLAEINRLSAQLRDLRSRFTRRDRPREQVRMIEEDLRAKWEALRTARAGGITPEPVRRPGGKYWR